MDTHTLDLLEFDKVRALVAARAACSLGKEARWGWSRQRPRRDPRPPVLTTEMVEARAGLGPSFGGLHDIRPLVRRAQVGAMLEAEELAETAETLRALGDLDRWLTGSATSSPGWAPCARASANSRASSRPSTVASTAGPRSSIPPAGGSRRSAARSARSRSGSRRRSGTCSARPRSGASSATRISRWWATITSCRSPRTIAARSRDRSSAPAPATRRSTSSPAIGEQSAQLSYLRAREAKEIRRILRWLSAQVGMVADSLLGTLETMAELDLIHARARLSLDYRMTAPHFNQEGRLVLRRQASPARGDRPRVTPRSPAADSRTPARRRRRAVDRLSEPMVPIDVNLGLRFHILVVTGPNTGGKTVAIKTVGLLAIMAQTGLHVPAAEGSQLPVFDDVLADIGDEQSLEQSLSTFSSHVRRIREILGKATRQLAGVARRDGRRHRPRRRSRARPGDPRRARQHRQPVDRDDAHRRPQDLRAIQPPAPRTPPSSSTTRRSSRSIGCTSATSASRTP